MSLIDDALRRAQAAHGTVAGTESALRVPMPLPDAGRYRRRYRRRLAAGILLAAAVLAGLALLWRRSPAVARSRSGGEGSVSVVAAAAPATRRTSVPTATSTATPIATAGRDSAARTPASGEIAPPTPIAPRVPAAAAGPEREPPTETPLGEEEPVPPGASAPPPPRQPRAREPVILPPIEVSEASGSPRLAEEPRPRRAAPPPRPEASRTRTFTGTANLPAGKLELEGIVYSETNPTALINGRVLSPGGYVDGYTVVKIERDRVELTGDGSNIVLTLK